MVFLTQILRRNRSKGATSDLKCRKTNLARNRRCMITSHLMQSLPIPNSFGWCTKTNISFTSHPSPSSRQQQQQHCDHHHHPSFTGGVDHTQRAYEASSGCVDPPKMPTRSAPKIDVSKQHQQIAQGKSCKHLRNHYSPLLCLILTHFPDHRPSRALFGQLALLKPSPPCMTSGFESRSPDEFVWAFGR